MDHPAHTMQTRKLDRSGIRETPGMPHWSEEVNARKPTATKRNVKLDPSAPIVQTKPPRVTVCPSTPAYKHTVRWLPESYQSQLSADECRPWVKDLA